MKKIYFIILFSVSAVSQAQIITIPDANFKNALVNFFIADLDNDGFFNDVVDTNDDGEIQVSEAVAVYGLELNGLNISSLEGIHEFTNLLRLLCGNNSLTSIDVSQNANLEELTLTNNQITSLDVSQNTNLTFLDFVTNEITSIDLTSNVALEFVLVSNNEFLTGLDISQNPNVTYVESSGNAVQEILNVKNGNNLNFTVMSASNNPILTCIQVDDEGYANSNPPGWMKDSSAEYSEDCILGINEYEEIQFSLYPNPTKELLNIHTYQNQHIESIKMYSSNGAFLKGSNSSSIMVSEFSAGLYFIEVLVNGKSYTKKFIKL